MCPYCPISSWSFYPGSSDVDDCKCYPGFGRVGDTCVACEVDNYAPDYDSVCIPCPPNAHTFNYTGMSYCGCMSGFYYNSSGDCVDINECTDAGINCQHGGTCNNVAGSYECVCVVGWTGQFCERDVNECAFLPCWNDGVCQNSPGSFTCTCPPGYTGRNCQLGLFLFFIINFFNFFFLSVISFTVCDPICFLQMSTSA